MNREVKDDVRIPFGVRTFRGSEKGFSWWTLLSSAWVSDTGSEGIGKCINKEHHREDMEFIRESGRCSSRALSAWSVWSVCQYGMIVWRRFHTSRHIPNGRENTISQMKELIVQNYNHLHVTWGISNEITISTRIIRICWIITVNSMICVTKWIPYVLQHCTFVSVRSFQQGSIVWQ